MCADTLGLAWTRLILHSHNKQAASWKAIWRLLRSWGFWPGPLSSRIIRLNITVIIIMIIILMHAAMYGIGQSMMIPCVAVVPHINQTLLWRIHLFVFLIRHWPVNIIEMTNRCCSLDLPVIVIPQSFQNSSNIDQLLANLLCLIHFCSLLFPHVVATFSESNRTFMVDTWVLA